jgi:hypothetical protein
MPNKAPAPKKYRMTMTKGFQKATPNGKVSVTKTTGLTPIPKKKK